jgi:hypothetical protein
VKLNNKTMKKTSILLPALFAVFTVQGQQAVVVTGGDAMGPGGSLSYSVGQAVYTTTSGSTGSVVQGVQQSFEIFTLSNADFTALSLSAVVYPNPTSDKVVLSLRDSDVTNLSYVLYDFNGRSLSSGVVDHLETPIALENLLTGVYILKVNQNSIELKTFKIIKK